MNKTKIEWVKNPDGTQGYTWNPLTGCLNNCPYCYARKLANTRLRERYLVNPNVAPAVSGWEMKSVLIGNDRHNLDARYLDPFYPRFWGDREWLHINNRKLKGIFVCDMSDLFGIGIPEEWTKLVLNQVRLNYKHRFYLLTKQPQNLQKFSPFPDNCWVGVSVTESIWFNRDDMLQKALNFLTQIQAKVKYISFEPLLNWSSKGEYANLVDCLKEAGISWVILGSQTKPLKHPKTEWVLEIVNACEKAGIPVFLKDTIAGVVHPEMEWAWRGAKLRQELPNG